MEEEAGAESKGGTVERALNYLLTTCLELLSQRQRLDVVLSCIERFFSSHSEFVLSLHLFIYSLTLFKVDISLRHLGIKLDVIPSLNVSQSQFSLNQILNWQIEGHIFNTRPTVRRSHTLISRRF